MRTAVLATLLLAGGCTAQEVDTTARVFSAAAPLLLLIAGPAGPACEIALRAACATAEVAAQWPGGPGIAVVPKSQ